MTWLQKQIISSRIMLAFEWFDRGGDRRADSVPKRSSQNGVDCLSSNTLSGRPPNLAALPEYKRDKVPAMTKLFKGEQVQTSQSFFVRQAAETIFKPRRQPLISLEAIELGQA